MIQEQRLVAELRLRGRLIVGYYNLMTPFYRARTSERTAWTHVLKAVAENRSSVSAWPGQLNSLKEDIRDRTRTLTAEMANVQQEMRQMRDSLDELKEGQHELLSALRGPQRPAATFGVMLRAASPRTASPRAGSPRSGRVAEAEPTVLPSRFADGHASTRVAS